MIMERFLRWNKNLEVKNRIMRCSGRKDTLMKLATDANKPGQLYDIKFQIQKKIDEQRKIQLAYQLGNRGRTRLIPHPIRNSSVIPTMRAKSKGIRPAFVPTQSNQTVTQKSFINRAKATYIFKFDTGLCAWTGTHSIYTGTGDLCTKNFPRTPSNSDNDDKLSITKSELCYNFWNNSRVEL